MVFLDVAVFATADVDWQRSLDPYVFHANYQLASFDMKLNLYPARPNDPTMIPLLGAVYDRVPDAGPVVLLAGDVRAAAHVVLPQGHGIPAIFCKFNRSGDAGVTIYTEDTGVNRSVQWLNYVLINADVLNASHAVLLHELIHAANYVGNTGYGNRHDSDPNSIMRESEWIPGLPLPLMFERHAEALRQSYFARAT